MIFLFISICFLCIISLHIWQYTFYFEIDGIPHEKPWPILGNMGPIFFRRIHILQHINNFCRRWKNAKYFGFYDFTAPVIILRDANLIKIVGVKNFDSFSNHRNLVDDNTDYLFSKSLFGLKGSKWKEVRNLMSPVFTTNKMKQMFEMMSKRANMFTNHVIKEQTKETEIDIKEAFMRYTNDIITLCAYGIETDSMQNDKNEFFMYGKRAVNFSGLQATRFLFTRSFPKLAKLLHIHVLENCVTNFFTNIIDTIINIRKKEKINHINLLQFLIEAKEKNNLEITDIAAQAFTFFFAGLESSSALMSFASIIIAMNPDIQESLHKEINDILKMTNECPTYESINQMPYLEAVLYETLRYYPIIPFVDRICTKEFTLPPALPGLKPYTVKVGTNVWFPVSGIHEDCDHYTNPQKFDPERFLNKKVNMNDPTFLSFGIGPRVCIGNRFAMIETKLVLFYMLSKCSFEVSPKLHIPIKLNKSSFNLSIEGGFWLKIRKRKCE